MPVQSIERHEFCGRSFSVAKIARPIVAVHGSDHRLLVGKHLTNAICIYNFNIGKVAQYFQDAPLVRSWFVAQSLVGQSRYGCCDLLWTFFRGFEVLFQFGFVHDALTCFRLFASPARPPRPSPTPSSWYRATALTRRVPHARDT